MSFLKYSGLFSISATAPLSPRIQELVIDEDDYILRNEIRVVQNFENTLPTASNYRGIIDDIRDMVLKKKTQKSIANFELWVHAIDQNGQACTIEGNSIIKRIATKFGSDFHKLQLVNEKDLQNKVFSRSSWLYASTPDNVIAYVKNILSGDFKKAQWGWAAEAASRAFVDVADFRLLFESIARRAETIFYGFKSFPIGAARSICRILMFRKDGEKGLDQDMAILFTRRAIERLQDEQEARNFSVLYFQLIQLLLYLLRYRRTNPACFDPNSL